MQVVLWNIEVVDGRFLRFNFTVESWSHASKGVEVYLDNPQESTFLVDQRGRQHPLVQATGISDSQPTRLAPSASRRFALAFALPPDMEVFKYQAIIFVREGNLNERIQVRSRRAVGLGDFR